MILCEDVGVTEWILTTMLWLFIISSTCLMITTLPQNYQSIFSEITMLVKQARFHALYKVNTELIKLYLTLWKLIYQQTQVWWWEWVIEKLSQDLQMQFPWVRGFSARNLRRMQMIASQLDNTNLPQLVAELPRWHVSMIFEKVKNTDDRIVYLTKAKEYQRSRATLQEYINQDSIHNPIQHNFWSTLPVKIRSQLARELKDEYNLSFLWLEQEHTEKQLENRITTNIPHILSQLGKDFAFMGRQYKLEVAEKEYFIDLLFYHRKLQCMIAIELKIGDFKPEYTQQLNRYLHILDKQVKYESDNPSIGILICRSKDKLLVEYALELATQPIWVATYRYKELPQSISNYLPNEETLQDLLGNTNDYS